MLRVRNRDLPVAACRHHCYTSQIKINININIKIKRFRAVARVTFVTAKGNQDHGS